MNTIKFNIVSGESPFEVELIGSDKGTATIYSYGEHTIYNVYDGIYTLKIVDANGCEHREDLVVNPSVTTTTTTVLPGNSLIVGHSQDGATVFNMAATNRNTQYSGYPDPNVVVLYLWLRTKDGKPLGETITLNYSISANELTGDSEFIFNSVSDNVNAEIIETSTGPVSPLTGNLILKENFIETYIEYVYNKGTVDSLFSINLESTSDVFDTNVNTTLDEAKTYGLVNIARKIAELNY